MQPVKHKDSDKRRVISDKNARKRNSNLSLFTCHWSLIYLAGLKMDGESYVTPTVIPECGLKLVSPLMPAKSKRNPDARTCMPSRASPCDSVPRGPRPGR